MIGRQRQMTVDASKPSNVELGYALDDYIRENRVEINSLWSALQDLGWIAVTAVKSVAMTLGQTTLASGTHVSDILLETVLLTAAGAVNLQHITNSRGGQIKILILGDGNVTIKHDASKIKLNGNVDLVGVVDDVLCLVNIGGVPGTSDGHWHELFRTLKA